MDIPVINSNANRKVDASSESQQQDDPRKKKQKKNKEHSKSENSSKLDSNQPQTIEDEIIEINRQIVDTEIAVDLLLKKEEAKNSKNSTTEAIRSFKNKTHPKKDRKNFDRKL